MRTATQARLDALDYLAEAPLRMALSRKPPLRVQEQVVARLEKFAEAVSSPQRLRLLRAVEALERIGTPEATELLRELSRGARGAEQTREAAASLKRLEGKGR